MAEESAVRLRPYMPHDMHLRYHIVDKSCDFPYRDCGAVDTAQQAHDIVQYLRERGYDGGCPCEHNGGWAVIECEDLYHTLLQYHKTMNFPFEEIHECADYSEAVALDI